MTDESHTNRIVYDMYFSVIIFSETKGDGSSVLQFSPQRITLFMEEGDYAKTETKSERHRNVSHPDEGDKQATYFRRG
jgi:hypothetical protein